MDGVKHGMGNDSQNRYRRVGERLLFSVDQAVRGYGDDAEVG
jgi:hypothetical protein